jgi:hypothetical protein
MNRSQRLTMEVVPEGMERWLKIRRDEYEPNGPTYLALDKLLDEVRETAAQGLLPWQRVSHGGSSE